MQSASQMSAPVPDWFVHCCRFALLLFLLQLHLPHYELAVQICPLVVICLPKACYFTGSPQADQNLSTLSPPYIRAYLLPPPQQLQKNPLKGK